MRMNAVSRLLCEPVPDADKAGWRASQPCDWGKHVPGRNNIARVRRVGEKINVLAGNGGQLDRWAKPLVDAAEKLLPRNEFVDLGANFHVPPNA